MKLATKFALTLTVGITSYFLTGKPAPEDVHDLTAKHKLELTESKDEKEGLIYLANKRIDNNIKAIKANENRNIGFYELKKIKKHITTIHYLTLFNDALELEKSVDSESKLKAFTIYDYLQTNSTYTNITIAADKRIKEMTLNAIIKEHPNSRLEFRHFALVFENNYDFVTQASMFIGLVKNSENEFKVTIYGILKGEPNWYIEKETKTIDLAKNDYNIEKLFTNN